MKKGHLERRDRGLLRQKAWKYGKFSHFLSSGQGVVDGGREGVKWAEGRSSSL